MIKKLRRRFILSAMLAVVLVLFSIMGAINVLNYYNVVTEADKILQVLASNDGQFPDQDPAEAPDKTQDSENSVIASSETSETGTDTGNASGDTQSAAAGDTTKTDTGTTDTGDTTTTNTGTTDTGDTTTTDTGNTQGTTPEDPGAGKNGDSGPGSGSIFDVLNEKNGLSAETPYESRYFTVTIDSSGEVTDTNVESIAAVDTTTASDMALEVYEAGDETGFRDFYRYLMVDTDDGGTMVIFLDCQRGLNNARSFFLISILVCLVGTAAVLVLVILLSAKIVKPVEESYLKQKRFITDAGHDLKTPLTIIDADVSVAEMDNGPNEWLDDIKVQTKRMTGLTNDLIYLSRMDEGENKMTMIDFPLSDVVSETVQSFRSRAQVEEKTFDYEIDPMITYCGDEKYITRLVTILLDNALKYSDDHGTIRVTLKKRSKGFEFRVYNTAESIDKDTLHHMFDRFYRADKSRNSSKGGYGIGLSIASAIVSAHKGKITATSDDGKSLLVTVIM